MSSVRQPDHQNRIARSTIAAIFTLSISGFFLGIGIISHVVVQAREDLEFEKMQKYNLFSAQQSWIEGDFLTCIIEANKVFSGLSYADAQSVKKGCQKGRDEEHLNMARRFQREGNQEDALRLVASIAEENTEAKKMMEEISAVLLAIGKRHYQERSLNHYNDAAYPISTIPPASSYYNTAQTLLKQWREEHNSNNEHILVAIAALEQEEVLQAQQALAQVSDHPFWQDYIKPIHQAIEASVIFERAEALMESREWENAIAEASKLPNIPPWTERSSNLISRAKATLQRKDLCKTVTFGLWQKCYL